MEEIKVGDYDRKDIEKVEPYISDDILDLNLGSNITTEISNEVEQTLLKDGWQKIITEKPSTLWPEVPNQKTQYGWVCPTCGKVYAPFMPECNKCPQISQVIVTNAV